MRINLDRTPTERNYINKEFKFLRVAQLRDIEQMLMNDKISYSRSVELINELAFDFYIRKKKLK